MITNETLRRPLSKVTRPAYRLHRLLTRRPCYLFRLNHPVAARLWDWDKGISGWVASDEEVSSIEVKCSQGTSTTARLLRRPDVEWHLGFQFNHQIGFAADISFVEGIDKAGSLDVELVIQFESGNVKREQVRLEYDIEEQTARYQRYRPLYQCPSCGSALSDVEGGLNCEQCNRLYPIRHGVVNFLPERAFEDFGVDDTENISSWDYDDRIKEVLARKPDGLYLDCGAGLRNQRYPNVINLEIVRYSSTDVIGVGECLPFADNSLDGVISIAVLEHVRDPFRCAAEIKRVLKPGGWVFAAVPFLQPFHGYPNHYYNMTKEGLRNLFMEFKVEDQFVPGTVHPVEVLRWFLYSYSKGLPKKERNTFEGMTMKDIMTLPPTDDLAKNPPPFVKNLSIDAQFELASATYLIAHKGTD